MPALRITIIWVQHCYPVWANFSQELSIIVYVNGLNTTGFIQEVKQVSVRTMVHQTMPLFLVTLFKSICSNVENYTVC